MESCLLPLVEEAGWIKFLFAAFFTSSATSSFTVDVAASAAESRPPENLSQPFAVDTFKREEGDYAT
jgi:hypothetical protein